MKRIPLDAKINAYNDAIAALRMHESDSDTPEDVDARHWLADKLDKEADRLQAKLNARADSRSQS
jgi:hypothetical protein